MVRLIPCVRGVQMVDENPIEIVVFGEAKPAGSKTAFQHPHTKQMIVTDASKGSRPWKNNVAQAAGQQYGGELLTDALVLEVDFYEVRPKSHYGTGRNAGIVKESAPMYPSKKPDATKLLRGTEDALTGIVYRDDSQVVEQHVRKLYGSPARAEITIRRCARQHYGAGHLQRELLAA